MTEKLRVLMIEDVEADAQLSERELKQAGFQTLIERVETKDTFIAALDEFKPDIVLIDYNLPTWDWISALAVMREKQPGTPVIFVSGTIGEEFAIEAMKAGATDYVFKDKLPKLGIAVKRALGELAQIKERKKAESAIIESEQKFRQLAENIEHVFWLTDWKEKKLLYVSPAYEKVFCMSVESAYEDRLSWKKAVHPDDLERVDAALREHAQKGENFEIEYRIKCKHIVKWIHEFAFPVTDENGEISWFINVAEDITERKLADMKILNEEKKYRELLDTTTDVIFTLDLEGNVIEATPSMEKVVGWSNDDLLGKPLSQFVHPDDLRIAESEFFKAIQGNGQPIEVRILRPDKTYMWVYINALLIMRNSEPDSLLCVLSNINKRKMAEKALRESEEIFRTFMEHSPIYVFFKDENIRAIQLSKNYETMLGKPMPELLGKNMDDLFPSELAKTMVADDKAILKEGKTITIEEEFNDRQYLTTKFPISLEGKPRYLAGYSIDITERKQMEGEAKKYSENLRLKVEEKTREVEIVHDALMKQERLAVLGQMAASVSHELRNPLSVINNVAYYLKTKFPDADEKTLKMLDLLENEVERSDRIIGNMLGFSRQKPNILEDVDLNELVNNYFSTLDNIPGNVSLTLRLSQKLPVLQADSGKLNQVLDNLVSNACNAMSEHGGSLTVSTALKSNSIKLSVKDAGHGMSPDVQAQIFEPLFSTRTTGFGLGLAIVKVLVKDHGGEIMVKSKEGEGSEFTVLLPLDAGANDSSDERRSD